MPGKHLSRHHSHRELVKTRRRFTVVNMLLVAVLVIASYWVLKFVLANTNNGNPYSCSSYPTLQYGSKDSGSNGCVHYLQWDLNLYGYGLAQDGIFGTNTKNAVRDYQSRHGLTVDGIVGTNTWNSINKQTAKVVLNFCVQDASHCTSSSVYTATPGQSLNLSWRGDYSNNCVAGQAWSGTYPSVGSKVVTASKTPGTYYYYLKCQNDIFYAQGLRQVNVVAKPTVSMKINGGTSTVSVQQNGSVKLSWTTGNSPTSCTAGGSWTGSKSTSSSSQTISVGSTIGTRSYYMTCSNSAGSTKSNTVSANVTQAPPPAGCGAGTDNSKCKPTVVLKINNQDSVTVNQNSSVTMSWTVGFSPTSCVASGSWGGAKTAANASTVINVGSAGSKTYTLACSNANGTSSDSVTATVKSTALPHGCGPGTDNSTCTIKPGTNGKGSNGSGKNPVSDKTAPSVPGNFKAKLSANASIVMLSWNASTDASGINSYQLERSTDKTNWQVLSTKIVTTNYTDSSATYKTPYFYRVRAVDNAGNASGYATANITTGEFKATTDGTLIESSDHIVQVTMGTGALGGVKAACSIEPNSANVRDLSPVKLDLVYGPYELACKTAEGDFLASFKEPVEVRVYPEAGKAKKYKSLKIYQYNFSEGTWDEVQVKTEQSEDTVVLSFSTDKPFQIAVMGERKPGLPWGIISFILLILIAIGGFFVYRLRAAQKAHYQDYLRRKYYNL